MKVDFMLRHRYNTYVEQWKDGYVGILIDETIDGYGGMTDNADKDADASLELDV